MHEILTDLRQDWNGRFDRLESNLDSLRKEWQIERRTTRRITDGHEHR